MSTTNGNMKKFRVTDQDGNVFLMIPVDTEARQAIDDAKSLNFDDDFFTAEETDDEVNIGLNGVPIGVEENTPLIISKDDAEGFILTCKALFGNNFCSEYNSSTGTYSVNDYTIYQGKIYRCITAIGTAEDFNVSKWQEVIFLDYDLNEAPVYSSIPYILGAYCHHDGKLYKCTTAITSGETWNPSKWTEVNRVIAGTLESYVTKASVANEYSTSSTYALNDYCYYQGNLYRCTTAITSSEAWNSNHWIAVSRLGSDISTLFNKANTIITNRSATVSGTTGTVVLHKDEYVVATISDSVVDIIVSCDFNSQSTLYQAAFQFTLGAYSLANRIYVKDYGSNNLQIIGDYDNLTPGQTYQGTIVNGLVTVAEFDPA